MSLLVADASWAGEKRGEKQKGLSYHVVFKVQCWLQCSSLTDCFKYVFFHYISFLKSTAFYQNSGMFAEKILVLIKFSSFMLTNGKEIVTYFLRNDFSY